MLERFLPVLAIAWVSAPPAATPTRLLVFSKIAPGGYFQEAIPVAAAAIIRIGKETGFEVDTTSDSRAFTRANLARYRAVFFNHAYGDVLDSSQQSAFQAYIRGGGGYAGLHASSYVELDWPWYRSLVGAYFSSHSAVTGATVTVEDRSHPTTLGLPTRWTRTDEWYAFDANPRPDVRVLLTVDEKTYAGGTMGADHPIVWCHEFDGGRAWYSAMGHTFASYSEPEFLLHLRGGILYALGQTPPIGIFSGRPRSRPGLPALPILQAVGGGMLFRGGGSTSFSALGVLKYPSKTLRLYP